MTHSPIAIKKKGPKKRHPRRTNKLFVFLTFTLDAPGFLKVAIKNKLIALYFRSTVNRYHSDTNYLT